MKKLDVLMQLYAPITSSETVLEFADVEGGAYRMENLICDEPDVPLGVGFTFDVFGNIVVLPVMGRRGSVGIVRLDWN